MNGAAYHADWLYRRVQEGFAMVRNPMNAHQVSRISLDPAVIDCIVFWTKDATPMLDRLDELDAYRYYFQFTLTGYGRDFEPGVADKRGRVIPTFRELARRIEVERVIWRYDPIAFSEKYTPDYHLRAFRSIAQELAGSTEKCVISFVDAYRRNQRSLRELRVEERPDEELLAFSRELAAIAAGHGMAVATCAERIDLAAAGIAHNACIDKALIGRIMGGEIKVGKDGSQRAECGCMASIDIGGYNSCAAGCRYCYATFSQQAVRASLARRDPDSPLLCDALRECDVVRDRPMRSLAASQSSLF